jgi:hypothetical protein
LFRNVWQAATEIFLRPKTFEPFAIYRRLSPSSGIFDAEGDECPVNFDKHGVHLPTRGFCWERNGVAEGGGEEQTTGANTSAPGVFSRCF